MMYACPKKCQEKSEILMTISKNSFIRLFYFPVNIRLRRPTAEDQTTYKELLLREYYVNDYGSPEMN